jgi:hypothetical protein
MSIPLDRLYNFLQDVCNRDILIYRYFPHGSKNIEDLHQLKDYQNIFTLGKVMIMPVLICHDQEPLNFDFYTGQDFTKVTKRFLAMPVHPYDAELKQQLEPVLVDTNLRSATYHPFNGHDRMLLCHSEKNSCELAKYEQHGFIGVYWWIHALIAVDWYRYAQHDIALEFALDKHQHDFLIYNRAWSGTREYRLKFAEMLIDQQVVSTCNVKFCEYDGGHYTQHQYKNPAFAITRNDIENYLAPNTSTSCSSADYNNQDYQTSAIEVVLETLFDDNRVHLTEKALRPIACGKPFILLATPGSLEYLRSYGFQTFAGLIDESYDTVQDPVDRLKAVVTVMKTILQMPLDQKHRLLTQMNIIAEYNKQRFFGEEFTNSIIDEFKQNFDQAVDEASKYRTGKYFKLWKQSQIVSDVMPLTTDEITYIESNLSS